jgi:hypothetical protein
MHAVHFVKRFQLLWIALLLVSAVSVVTLSGHAEAQTKPFLADKHGAKGLNCAACHKESPPKCCSVGRLSRLSRRC